MSLLIMKGVPSQRMINLLWAYLTFIFMVWIRLLWRNFQEMIEEESELGNTMLGSCATISSRKMHATSLISLSSADLSVAKVFKTKQTAQTAGLQSSKMCNFQTKYAQECIYKKAGEEIWGTELMGFCMPGTGKFAFRAFWKTFTHTTVAFVAFLASLQKNYQAAAILATLLQVTLW